METTKENLKKLLMDTKMTTAIDMYPAMFTTKEDLIDDILSHDSEQINQGLKVIGWDFNV